MSGEPPAHGEDEMQEAAAAGGGAGKVDLSSLPIRAYLDQAVVPVLLSGLSALVKERPANPIEFLANYLLANNPQKPREGAGAGAGGR